jgi:hypothetical protein
MYWQALESSHLPGFVYDRSKPGYSNVVMHRLGKGDLSAIQRMETPVIYFYSDNEIRVDVTVKFPGGTVTEWFPRATRIGPAFGEPQRNTASDSLIEWAGLKILPAHRHLDAWDLVPSDNSGSHYFAARNTDADFVRADVVTETNSSSETDKFLFYRGVGKFATPLTVTMQTDDRLTLTNTGTNLLEHLFVFRQYGGKGQLVYLASLAARSHQTVELTHQVFPLEQLSSQLESGMTAALTDHGLYPREASAMVDTWKSSWFEEEGLRVLYLLPRPWTDSILPLELRPQSRELVRVMVGRTEMLSPGLETRIRDGLKEAVAGDEEARGQLITEFKRLGRFASPALQRATRDLSDPQIARFGYSLLKPVEAGAK